MGEREEEVLTLVERILELQELMRKLEFELCTVEMARDLDPLSPEQSEMLRYLKRKGIEDLKQRDER